MYRTQSHPPRRPMIVGLVALLGAACLASCETTEEIRRANLDEDTDTCSEFGGQYGSRQYTQCMLAQQQRRDDAPLRAAEQQRASAEAARNNVETLRRIRCERDRRESERRGERPRPCR